MISAICPNCHILLVEAHDSSSETEYSYASHMATAENTAAALGVSVISNSWTVPDKESLLQLESAFNHPGVLITAASGDHSYQLPALWPAASPNVMSVGGTTLVPTNNARGYSEWVWPLGGSGCASYQAKPSWQTDTGCAHRTENDISADADWTNSAISIYDSYAVEEGYGHGWESWGGTSASTPIIAGTYALTNAYTRSLGADAIYQYVKEGGTLNDIVSGSNTSNGKCPAGYLCEAGPGFDGPSGWGTPWGAPVVVPPPSVTPHGVTNLGATYADLTAYVNPNGLATSYQFEYGKTAGYGSRIPAAFEGIGSGTQAIYCWNEITGLEPGGTYHFRVVATSAAGTTYGPDEVFTGGPIITPHGVTNLSTTHVDLTAYVDPNYFETSYQFEYGKTTKYGSKIPSAPEAIGNGTQPIYTWNEVTGLEPGATYHFRIAVSYNGTTIYGPDESFTTGPIITPHGVTNLSVTHADLTEYVDPNYFETSYQFEYGKTTKYGSKIPAAPEGIGSGTQAIYCWNEITGLEPGATYHFRIALTYGGTTTYGPDESFTDPQTGESLVAPSAVVEAGGSGRNVFYPGPSNDIWDWLVSNAHWENVALLTATGGTEPMAANTSPSAVVEAGGSGRNVFYVGANGRIWNWVVNGTHWENVELAAIGVGPNEVAITSPSAVVEAGGSGRNVFYVGANGRIWDWLLNGSHWENVELAATGVGPNEIAITSPSAVVEAGGSGRNVFYVGANGRIWDWVRVGTHWENVELATAGVGPNEAAVNSPSAVVEAGGSGRNVFYVGANGRIWDWLINGTHWENVELDAVGVGANEAAASGSSPSAVVEAGGSGRNVFYVGANGRTWDWLINGTHWENVELSAVGVGANEAAATGSSPSAVVEAGGSGRNVFYIGANGRTWDWLINGTHWENTEL